MFICLYEYTTIGTVCQERIRVRRPPHLPAALWDRRLQTRCQANRIRGVLPGDAFVMAHRRGPVWGPLFCSAAARSLAQMSRDSKVKMRALRGERLEKDKIKSRARRPLPFTHTAAAPQSASGRGAAAGRDGRSGTAAALSAVLCARYFCMVYGRRPVIGVILPTKFDIIFKNEILSEKCISLLGETHLFNRAQVHILFAGERKHICLSCSLACSNRPTPRHSIGVRRRISFAKNKGDS